jgi:hypothetical protein
MASIPFCEITLLFGRFNAVSSRVSVQVLMLLCKYDNLVQQLISNVLMLYPFS